MPSPIGHAVAGVIVALAGERRLAAGELARLKPRPTSAPIPWTLIFLCMVLAMLPDIDWIYPLYHRGPTHSLGATALVTLIAAAVSRTRTGRTNWRVAVVCGLAYSSHVLLDWLGEDPTVSSGVAALWPLSDQLFISGFNFFRSTERLEPFAPPQLAHNIRTLVQEMVILGPIVLWLLWRRTKGSPSPQ